MKRLLLATLMAASAALAAAGCSSPAPAPPAPSSSAAAVPTNAAAVNVFSMTGALDQITVADSPLMAAGATCSGSGDYADVHVGSVISVFDPSGHLLATGAVNSSSYGYVEHASSCRLNFTVPAVPDGPPAYGVEIAEHGVHQITSIAAHNTVLISTGP